MTIEKSKANCVKEAKLLTATCHYTVFCFPESGYISPFAPFIIAQEEQQKHGATA
jgi:hypothetical protein